MIEIAQLLKQTREAQGKTLEEISSQTKIQLPTLQALESGNFSKLTNKAFLKGFIRQYAKALGLNADEMVASYDKSFAGSPEPKPVPVSKLDSNQLTEKTNVLWFRTPSQFITLGAVIIILTLITSIYFLSIKIVSYSQETVRTELSEPTEDSPAVGAAPVENLITPQASVPAPALKSTEKSTDKPAETKDQKTKEDEAVAVAAAENLEEEEPPPRGVAPTADIKQKMVTLEARSNVSVDASWSTGKKEAIQLNANSRHVFYYLEKIKIVISDGGAIKVTTHEKVLGIPGESGKPITINFN